MVGVRGTSVSVQGSAVVRVTMAKTAFPMRVMVLNSLSVEAILGIGFLKDNLFNILVGEELLDFPNNDVSAPLKESGFSKHVLSSWVSQPATVYKGTCISSLEVVKPFSVMN